jgi:predicted DNA-binding ribbon-helix-helix protein
MILLGHLNSIRLNQVFFRALYELAVSRDSEVECRAAV